MKKLMTADELARDSRFKRVTMGDQFNDPRNRAQAPEASGSGSGSGGKQQRTRFLGSMKPEHPDTPDRARALMHGIFVGEIQALEGAGRTCWDFEVGKGTDEVPFEMKLDMARQCWDETRHCEISVKLSDWMGTEIGEFAESAFLFQAACNPDPILRLTGVNRGLEGLAIDVFNTMKEFGDITGDPVLEFCEDWMLADEVTHVKMGSDWLRRITADDPDRRERALEFQRVVDKLFSLGGGRGEEDDSAIRLARRFRELAGFTTEEIDEISDLAKEARKEMVERMAAAASSS
ncbi:MAG: hypothetical protein QOF60_1822 [Actinomycetota bacterium]|jgi:uncharacterized ferritin-like protein (DUF455 family)|nr:hypothetical protein [Actinomycetota bacterium]